MKTSAGSFDFFQMLLQQWAQFIPHSLPEQNVPHFQIHALLCRLIRISISKHNGQNKRYECEQGISMVSYWLYGAIDATPSPGKETSKMGQFIFSVALMIVDPLSGTEMGT